jgi:Leucine-rich repeat (LRR) protein
LEKIEVARLSGWHASFLQMQSELSFREARELLMNAETMRTILQQRLLDAEREIAAGNTFCKLTLKQLGLTTLPKIPEGVYELHVEQNELTTIEEGVLPESLRELYCEKNQLVSLPTLPPNLYILHCNKNRLTQLPEIPPKMWNLVCYTNQLTSLPRLDHLTGLDALWCDNNKLTEIPALSNDRPLGLWCCGNQLTSLPSFANVPNMKQLRCENNKLTEIPPLPNSLIVLNCRNNQLTALPPLPKTLVEVLAYGNLAHLPYMNKP